MSLAGTGTQAFSVPDRGLSFQGPAEDAVLVCLATLEGGDA